MIAGCLGRREAGVKDRYRGREGAAAACAAHEGLIHLRELLGRHADAGVDAGHPADVHLHFDPGR